ncbi:MAG TPA: hypothetical protein VME92_13160 [Acetobacteraceae bacterium]|nr:hypothetical protein [Acetobacteraceae bacterium]
MTVRIAAPRRTERAITASARTGDVEDPPEIAAMMRRLLRYQSMIAEGGIAGSVTHAFRQRVGAVSG